jgi:hypothetical protein
MAISYTTKRPDNPPCSQSYNICGTGTHSQSQFYRIPGRYNIQEKKGDVYRLCSSVR